VINLNGGAISRGVRKWFNMILSLCQKVYEKGREKNKKNNPGVLFYFYILSSDGTTCGMGRG